MIALGKDAVRRVFLLEMLVLFCYNLLLAF